MSEQVNAVANGYVYLKNISGTVIKPITDLSAINMTITNGIAVEQVNGGTIGIRDGYIESCYYTEMVDPGVGPANVDSAYIEGGTMFTLIGGYTVSDEIPPAADADPYKIPSELSVRSAIDAIATLGPSLTPGAGIVVTTVPGSTGGILSVAGGNGVEVNTAQQGGVSVKAGTGISVDSNGVSVVTATNNTFGGIAGATNGVTLVNGVAQVDAGDGLLIDSGKVAIDEASVEATLQDVRIDEGSTVTPVDDQVLTPGNLRGALSVGQAVDVSCKATYKVGITMTYPQDTDFLGTFSGSVSNAPAGGSYNFGFYNSASYLFPKRAPNLKYLMMFDFRNTGGRLTVHSDSTTGSRIYYADMNGVEQHIEFPFSVCQPGQEDWTRFYCIFSGTSGYAYIRLQTYSGGLVSFDIKNWRQYEVTNLTDEAIAYIAQLPDPDAFFRSTSAYSIRDKYLIKQDMVCPFIPTINMPDNSDLTVAAGLSYKIKYTNNNTHTITADTIPTDAYGWDTHIQMFIKGTSAINFQKPLVLMDALTPNAGHNLSVKWRNGDALVYVDDTNAGYIVTVVSGTETGSLYDGISNDYTDYVIFVAGLDGTTVDAGDTTFSGGTGISAVNVLGNGTDNTIITGNISATSGNTINFQYLTIDGSTFGGSGAVNFDNVSFKDSTDLAVTRAYLNSIVLAEGSTVTQKDSCTIQNNVNISGTGSIVFRVTNADQRNNFSGTFDGITIYCETTVANRPALAGVDCIFNNVNVIAPTRAISPTHSCIITGSTFTSEDGGATGVISVSENSTVSIDSSTIDGGNGYSIRQYSKSTLFLKDVVLFGVIYKDASTRSCSITISGTCKQDNYIGASSINDYGTGVTNILVKKDTIFDVSGLTHSKILNRIKATFEDNVTVDSGTTTYLIDGCKYIYSISKTGTIETRNNTPLEIVTEKDVWSATNITFASPLNAYEVSTIRLIGTTFTGASRISNSPMRIQLPANTTLDITGNTNAADTKILQAPIIVVGNDPTAPAGEATVVGGTVSPATISGIGTYIDKEGDNDFVALENINTVTVATGTTATAESLASAFAQTTGADGENRWIKMANGLSATVEAPADANVDVVDKNIITNEYEPVLGGTYSISSGGTMTVDEATKIATIESAAINMIDTVIPKSVTVVVGSGGDGVNTLVNVQGTGVIDFNKTRPNLENNAYISGTTLTNTYGSNGGVRVDNVNATLEDCVLTGNVKPFYNQMGTALFTRNNHGNVTLINTKVYGNEGLYPVYATDQATIIASGCEFSDTICLVSGGKLTFKGENKLSNEVIYRGGLAGGSVTLSSGAILDLTGNSNATPIAPGGGITFEQGGATVKVGDATASSSYMMDNVTLPAGAKLTNTTTVDLGGTTTAYCYGSASGFTIVSGFLLVASGGVADSFIAVGNDARIYVRGGTANNATINSTGYLYISSGGVANNITLLHSYLYAFPSGVVNNATVNNLCKFYVNSGGVANEPVINSGGSMRVSSGGTALLVTSNTGAIVVVEDGGYITYK